jgi:hypothetical protein
MWHHWSTMVKLRCERLIDQLSKYYPLRSNTSTCFVWLIMWVVTLHLPLIIPCFINYFTSYIEDVTRYREIISLRGIESVRIWKKQKSSTLNGIYGTFIKIEDIVIMIMTVFKSYNVSLLHDYGRSMVTIDHDIRSPFSNKH